MPFQSDKQRRYLWANEPEIAREWTNRYGANEGGITRLPFYAGTGQEMIDIGTPLTNQMAKVMQKDIDASKMSGFKNQDYESYKNQMELLGGTKVTPYEFKGLQEGTITEPGNYKKEASLNDPYAGIEGYTAESPIIMRDFDYDRTTNPGGIVDVEKIRALIENSRNQGMTTIGEDTSDLFGIAEVFPEQNIGEKMITGLTKNLDNTFSGIGKGASTMYNFLNKNIAAPILGGIATVANRYNPLKEGSQNYNPNLQGQVDMLETPGWFNRLSGEDPSGPYRITSGPLKGKNLVSGFGTNDYGRMLQKRIDYFKNKKSLTETQNRKMHETIAEQMRIEREKSAAQAAAQTRYEASKASGREGGGWYGGADYSGGKSGDVAQAGPGRDPEDRM